MSFSASMFWYSLMKAYWDPYRFTSTVTKSLFWYLTLTRVLFSFMARISHLSAACSSSSLSTS